MSLVVYRKLVCKVCATSYPPAKAEPFTGSGRELRDQAQGVGWDASTNNEQCPSCRIRHIEALMNAPRAAEPLR